MKTVMVIAITTLIMSTGLHAAETEFTTRIDSMPDPMEGQSVNAWTTFNDDGSIEFSEETIRLLSDATYRTVIYPEKYDINAIPEQLKEHNLLLALWTLINVLPDDQERVRGVALKLAQHGVRSQHYLNAYYTYVFADPAVFAYGKNTISHIAHPDVMEEKLASCKLLATYTDKFEEYMNTGDK